MRRNSPTVMSFSPQYKYSMKIVCITANSADPDEMPHVAAFHLALH